METSERSKPHPCEHISFTKRELLRPTRAVHLKRVKSCQKRATSGSKCAIRSPCALSILARPPPLFTHASGRYSQTSLVSLPSTIAHARFARSPYVALSDTTCSPHKCAEFGKFTAKSSFSDGDYNLPTWSKSDCSEGDTVSFDTTDSCPAFNIGDANANYPDPACPSVSAASSVGSVQGFVVSLVMLTGFLL